MKLRHIIMIRVGLLICFMALALSGTFYWIYGRDVKQRSQQTIEAAFSLLEDSLHRKQREMAREVEKLNYPIRAALDQMEDVRRNMALPQADTRLNYLQEMMTLAAPLTDHLYSLAEALGREGLLIALYDRERRLLLYYAADSSANFTTYLYLPELRTDALLVQRRKTLLVGADRPRTILAEDRINRLTDSSGIETGSLPLELALSIPAENISGISDKRFSRLGHGPALQYRVPVHGVSPSFDYFVPMEQVDQGEPNNGLLELTQQVQASDIQQIAAMTHTEVNTFADDKLACGTLQTYTMLAGKKDEAAVGFAAFVGNPSINQVVPRMVDNHSYYEGRMTIGNGDGPVGTFAVLLSRQAERHAAAVLFCSISGAAVAFGLLAGVDIIRFSKKIADPIRRMVSSMQQLAVGEAATDQGGSEKPALATFSELIQMNSALDGLVRANEETVTLAEAIAAGNLTVQITPRSVQDRLRLSLNRMVQQLHDHHNRTTRAMEETEAANQALAEINRKLKALSATDALTGIANRRQFDAMLAREHARHSRSKAELSLILLDIDAFKAFNDLYGHPQGDACLQQIGMVLADCTQRSGDLAARYGGEEFACILPETGGGGALAIAERIRQAIMTLAIPHAGSQVSDVVTASLGVITARCNSTESSESLLDRVDTLLYQEKSTGRNRVVAG